MLYFVKLQTKHEICCRQKLHRVQHNMHPQMFQF